MHCVHCGHPQGDHELGRGRGSCLYDGCACRGFDPELAGAMCCDCLAPIDRDGRCKCTWADVFELGAWRNRPDELP